MNRKITKTYQDPLEIIWINCANTLGIQVIRDDEVFASWDGKSTLRLGLDSLDADDSVGQLIFHELCHVLVEGLESMSKPDWGLNDERPAPRTHEFATLRLQACLAGQFGLRKLFAATTDFREYFDRIPNDVSATMDLSQSFEIIRTVTRAEDDEAIRLYEAAQARLDGSPWNDSIRRSLSATQKLFEATKEFAPENSLWHCNQ